MSATLRPDFPFPPPPDDRSERYRQRLDAHLETLPNDFARRRFCDREFIKWEKAYADWRKNPEIEPNACATDYLLTLGVISVRQIKYREAVGTV